MAGEQRVDTSVEKMTRAVTKLIAVKVTHTAQIAYVNRGIRPSSAVTSLNLYMLSL